MIEPDDIPADFEIRPIRRDDQGARCPVTCGTCGLTWDDGKVTSMTPAPSGRCPFEAFHEDESDELEPGDKVYVLAAYVTDNAFGEVRVEVGTGQQVWVPQDTIRQLA